MLVPVSGGAGFPSSDFEGRSNFYHDSANVQTQGGNLDYGLRQYVSAVEFKAGPLTNPHAPRVESGRARATIVNAELKSGTYVLTLDDASSFPDPPFSLTSGGVSEFQRGDLLYIAEVETDTPEEVIYRGTNGSNITTSEQQIVIEPITSTPLTTSNMIGKTIYLKRASHSWKSISNPSDVVNAEEYTSMFDLGWTSVVDVGGSVDEFCIKHSSAYLKAGVNSVGFNIRKGDKIYGKYTASAYRYIGEVSSITDNTYSPRTNFTDATCDTDGTTSVEMDDTSKIVIGMLVTGSNIPSNTYVTAR